jgi:hypothetical protein
MNQVWLYIFLDIRFLLPYNKLLNKNNADKLHNFVNYKIIMETLKMPTLATVHLVTVKVPHPQTWDGPGILTPKGQAS